MKPLLVGEANPYGARPEMALYPLPEHASGDRLCRLIMQLERREYLKRFDRVNLCPQRWAVREARENARAIMSGPERAVVLLGSKVAGAFGYTFQPFTVRVQREVGGELVAVNSSAAGVEQLAVAIKGRVVVMLPHPSGLCRTWNDQGAFERARAALRVAGVL